MRSTLVLAALCSTLFAACGGAPGGDFAEGSANVTKADAGTTDAGSPASAPTFTFTSAFKDTSSGALAPGATATLTYDTARLPNCRATTDGVQAWSISAYVSGDGATAVEVPLPSGKAGVVSVPFELPYARDLALWFRANDDAGCVQWDSNYGGNFHFALAAAPDAVLQFRGNFSDAFVPAPGGPSVLTAGTTVDVDYALSRLSACRSSEGANPAWSVGMYFQIDSGAVSSQPLTQLLTGAVVGEPGHIALPKGARSLALWFQNNDAYGCNAWDSNYGSNYVFAIH